jgi:hypothetical protein
MQIKLLVLWDIITQKVNIILARVYPLSRTKNHIIHT